MLSVVSDAVKHLATIIEGFRVYDDKPPIKIGDLHMQCTNLMTRLVKLQLHSCIPSNVQCCIRHFNEIAPAINKYVRKGGQKFTSNRKRKEFVNDNKLRRRQHSTYACCVDEISRIVNGFLRNPRKSDESSSKSSKTTDNIAGKKSKGRMSRRLSRSETLPNLSTTTKRRRSSSVTGAGAIRDALMADRANKSRKLKSRRTHTIAGGLERPRTAALKRTASTTLRPQRDNGEDELVKSLYSADGEFVRRYMRTAGGSGFGGIGTRNTLGINNTNRSVIDRLIRRSKETALHIACRVGDAKFVSMMLENGANPNVPNKRHALPIHEAAMYGHVDIVKMLTKVTESKKLRAHPLVCVAANSGALEVVQYIIRKSPREANSKNKYGERPIFLALLMGHFHIVDYLLRDAGKLKTNIRTRDGWTLLDAAVACDAVGYMGRILDMGSSNSGVGGGSGGGGGGGGDSSGGTSSATSPRSDTNNSREGTDDESAIDSDDEDMESITVTVMSTMETSVHFQDINGLTALHRASSATMIEYLISMGADVNTVDGAGECLLHIAVRHGYVELLEVLAEQGSVIDPNLHNMNGFTPLHFAVENNDMNAVALLLRMLPRLDVNVCDERGLTPLHMAVRAKSLDMVKVLLACPNIDPNMRDNRGKSPLNTIVAKAPQKLKKDQTHLIKALIGAGADLMTKDSHDTTPLGYAFIQNNIQLARLLLENSVHFNVNEPISQGKTAIAFTCDNIDESRREEVHSLVTYLLARKADPNIANNQDQNALSFAYMNEDDDLLDILLQNRGNPNIKLPNGTPMFHHALSTRDNVTVWNMLKAKADLNGEDRIHGCASPLHRCVKAAQSEVPVIRKAMLQRVKMLLACGARQDIRDQKKRTPVVAAYQYGDWECAHIFFDFLVPGRARLEDTGPSTSRRSVPVSPRNARVLNSARGVLMKESTGGLPLTLDQENDNEPVIDWYQSDSWFHDTNILTVGDMRGDTILHLVARSTVATVKEVWNAVQCCPSIDVVNHAGETPLLVAVRARMMNTVRALIQAGSNVDLCDKEGCTPLMAATELANQNMISCLLVGRANIDAARADGMNSLMIACASGNSLVVETLLESGASCDVARNEQQWSPLHYATHGDMVEMLLSHKCDVDCVSEAGSTPLLVAVEHGRTEVVQALLDSGADVNLSGEDGVSPLILSVYCGNDKITNAVLDKNPSLEAATNELAGEFESCSLLHVLASVSKYNDDLGHPVVHRLLVHEEFRCMHGLKNVVECNRRFLLKHILDAGYELRDELQDALKYAAKHGQESIASILANELDVSVPSVRHTKPLKIREKTMPPRL